METTPYPLTSYPFGGQNVRVLQAENGEPQFVGKDVCDALGYADATNAMKRHCKGVAKRHPLRTDGGIQEVRILGEADVMRLLVHSKLPAAQEFERLVFEEILPTIRRTGAYGKAAAGPQPTPKDAPVSADWLARSMGNAQRFLQLAAGRVGMVDISDRLNEFSHPDIAMGLAALMFTRQRFLVEMESLESARLRALRRDERIVDLAATGWADRFVAELPRGQIVELAQAATRKLA